MKRLLTRILLPTFRALSRTGLLVMGWPRSKPDFVGAGQRQRARGRVEIAHKAEPALVIRGNPHCPSRVDQARLAVGGIDPILQIVVADRAQCGERRRDRTGSRSARSARRG